MSTLPWQLVYTTQARKDAKKLAHSEPMSKALDLLTLLTINPFQNPPLYEKLGGGLEGAYSRRLNVQLRLVYEVIEASHHVKILRMWTHYE